MKNKPVLISLIIVAALLAYLSFTLMFTWLFEYSAARPIPESPTPAPTFTATPTVTALVAMASATATAIPSATSTATVPAAASATPTAEVSPSPLPTPTPSTPQLVAAAVVNIRGGPGTNYPVVGQLPLNQPLPVLGQNEAASWWQVPLPDGSRGWVAAAVVEVTGTTDVPVVATPPPPVLPTPTPAPPPTPLPQFQYEPTGWFADTNYGLTRFLGTISDASGAPVNGVSVEAQCGDFRVISNPSGPVGWPPFYNSASDPPGFYDITLDNRPIPCIWFLTVVDSPDGKTVTARLSDAIEVEITVDTSIVTANWRKNW